MLENVLLRFFIIIIILSAFMYKDNPMVSNTNTDSETLDLIELKDSLKHIEIQIAPYENRLGEIYLSNPVFVKQIDYVN